VIEAAVYIMAFAMAETPSELNNRAVAHFREARYSQAEQLYRAALDGWQKIPGTERDRAISLNNLALLLTATARFEEARAAQEESVAQLRITDGERGRDTARALTNLADLYRLSGYIAKAEAAAREAIEIDRENGAPHTSIASANQVLASVAIEQRQFAKARGLLTDALALRERAPEAHGADIANIWNSTAAIGLQAGDYAGAEAAASKALAITRATRGESNPSVALCLNNLAQALRLQGRYAEAEPYYRQAIGAWEATLGRDHPDTAKGLVNLAGFFLERGRAAAAEALYLRARDIFSRKLGPEHPLALVTASRLVAVYHAERRFTEALHLSRAILPLLEGTLSADDPELRAAQATYALLTAETDRPGKKPRRTSALRMRPQ